MVSILDRISQCAMAIGIILIFQPYWDGGLKAGFFITLLGTILHIVTSHLLTPEDL